MPQKKPARPRGPTQEERRRKAVNKPLGGGVPVRPAEKEYTDDSYRRRTTRFQRITAIITIIMLVAIVLSIIPACFASGGVAAAKAFENNSQARQDLPEARLSYGSARFLQREAAELPPTASLPVPTNSLPETKYYAGDTGHFINGVFLDYWRKVGGVSVIGNPLSEEFIQNGRAVQLFEKALLEGHSEETDPKNQVQLAFLGRQLADARALRFEPTANTVSSPTRIFFQETGQTIAGSFKAFWEKNNGMVLLGLPISPEMSEDGTTVQYFERGLLQLRANSSTQVEVGNSGEALIKEMGWPRPTLPTLELNIEEDEIYQGRTLGLRLEPEFSWQIQDLKANLSEEALRFVKVGPAFRAFKSFGPTAPLKAYPLKVTYLDPAGRNRELSRTIKVVKFDFDTQVLGLPGDKSYLADQSADDYDNAQLAEVYRTFTPQLLWSGLWNWPAFGNITTGFGDVRTYADNPNYVSIHGGLDIAQGLGAPVAAPADGKVIYTGTLRARGKAVALDHGGGVTSYYYHLNNILVKPGDRLKKGQILGQVGTTGRSSGPHLHWEVRVNGTITWPLLFVKLDMAG